MDDPAPYLALLGTEVEVRIDRPLHSVHPEIPTLTYRTNYGYIPGTQAGDGEEIDVYVLGVDVPIERFQGVCVAVVLRKNDDEHKLVVAPRPLGIDAIVEQIEYIERDFDTEIILEGDHDPS